MAFIRIRPDTAPILDATIDTGNITVFYMVVTDSSGNFEIDLRLDTELVRFVGGTDNTLTIQRNATQAYVEIECQIELAFTGNIDSTVYTSLFAKVRESSGDESEETPPQSINIRS
ncbi:hypothetical protein QQ008_14125 [Fulvivirgaceae bacterium BMA10]|uniref:Uncharacterized protein n=1 Tax=Splendidivirga corallicola TaxID=3051826 RepID=A0ABT8KP75_9BACT|nr:hypothetical protein [Fulvivirgaceae bacterium BMA10]